VYVVDSEINVLLGRSSVLVTSRMYERGKEVVRE